MLSAAFVLLIKLPIFAQDTRLDFFESHIRPVLVTNCYECHNSSGRKEGDLALDSRDLLRAGGPSGALIEPGAPDKSLLLNILRHEVDGFAMPKDGAKLSPEIVADFERWIADGAIDPRDEPPTADELATASSWDVIREQRKQWWSFQPIQNVEPPALADNTWSEHPVDQFVLAKLREHDLEPAPPAENEVLIRRLFFTVIGLPPTVEEFAEWKERFDREGSVQREGEAPAEPLLRTRGSAGASPSQNSSPSQDEQAIIELIDHLLARPEFGERWARHWMDWIRYADSHGSEGDPPIVGAWQYRDYLIRALNADVPYDQLVREHVAGDLMDQPRINEELGLNESLIATSHWRMVFHGFGPTDALEERVRFTDDQLGTFSKAFLGLTVSCARCHNHKFDPISQADYYALFGVLNSCRPSRLVASVEQASDRQSLIAARDRVKSMIAPKWVDYAPELERRLLKEPGIWQHADSPRWLLYFWRDLMRSEANQSDFASWWSAQVAAWQKNVTARETFQSQSSTHRWTSNAADSSDSWSSYGRGISDQPSAAGSFQLAEEGPRIVSRIFPAANVSGLESQRDAARLESADLPLDSKQTLWLLVAGDRGARVRYAVQNFPRDGTVYPVARLGADWFWQKFDVGYWQGDPIHIELATALDGPLLTENNERSWLAVRQAVMQPSELAGPPDSEMEMLDPVFAAAAKNPPKSAEDLAALIAGEFRASVEAWRDGTMSDAQALLLDACVFQNLIPNMADQLPDVAAALSKWREIEQSIRVPVRVPGLRENVPTNQPLFVRGDHKQPSEVIPRRFLEAIDPTPYANADSGRRQLAEDVLRSDNPLTKRVIVNRLWHHAFGRGVVGTPDNFGRLGEAPTHPELLDYLATRFETDGWSIKSMLRLLLTSRAWQLSAQPSAAAKETDPGNRNWSHAMLRRMEAETIRDNLLAATGTLDRTPFGLPVHGSSNRRSVYVEMRRNELDPFLRAFDLPEPFTAVGRRDVTNVPAQGLIFLNDPRIEQLAKELVRSVASRDEFADDRERVGFLFRRVLNRDATPAETDAAIQQLEETKAEFRAIAADVLTRDREIGAIEDERQSIRAAARERVMKERPAQSSAVAVPSVGLEPLAAWDFRTGLNDQMDHMPVTLMNGARTTMDGLVLDGQNDFAISKPLPSGLRAKTLVVRVLLTNLAQRGGAAISMQRQDGSQFDAVVYAELESQRWMAGSEGFARTNSFRGVAEDLAKKSPVSIAMVWHEDGRIEAFRNGAPFGKEYMSNGPVSFNAGEDVVTFGVRHLSVAPGRMLAGTVVSASVFDRALNAEEIKSLNDGTPEFVSETELLAAMADEERERFAVVESRLQSLRSQDLVPPAEFAEWTELVRAMLSFKEFQYVR